MNGNTRVIPRISNSLGLLGYMIVINQQVHNYQIDALADYLNSIGTTIDDSVIKPIIDGSETAVSFDECFSSFLQEDTEIQASICYMILLLSQLDNIIDEKENLFISKILCASKLGKELQQSVGVRARENASRYRTTKNNLFDNTYLTGTKDNTNKRVSRKRLIGKSKASEKNISDEEYIRMISRCSAIAKEDYSIVHPYYSGIITNNTICLRNIEHLETTLKRDNELSTEVGKLVDEFTQIIKKEISQQTNVAEELLAQKERTLPDFTISLLGRTKAGKSTLHAILTNQGYDKIGYGKQRTTRYNRVYQWNMLRIIDTPGIGSAEVAGRTDDEIAQSVLGESDVICLVVVDDSILKDILDLMDRVSRLNKPVLILLNHKENIRNEVKYKRFISKPDKWLKDTGESNLQGHIDRITKYARDNGYEKLLKVFPVFLLAARMSYEEEYRENAELLRANSNIDPFINFLRKLVAEAGTIKRSQTIIDEAVQTLEQLNVQIDNSLQPIEHHIAFLQESRIKTIRALEKDRDVTAKRVKGIILEKGEVLANEKSKTFAREAFGSFEKVDRNDISTKWNEFVENSRIKDELEKEISNELEKYKSQVGERIKELFDDIYFNIKSEFVIPHMGVPTAVNFKKIYNICNTVMLVYCITSDLFNQYTKADFEKWAFTNDYAGKLFLVINKMSKEDGEYQQLVDNYSSTLNLDLYPHSIEEFAHCFFDAKDYKDGVMDGDKALVELSHFEIFIDKLNSFIESKGLLGRLDKPIQIIKSSMDVVNGLSLQSDKDRAYVSLVSRIENRIDRQRSDFSYESKRIIRNGMSKVRAKGAELSAYIGSDKNISEDNVRDIIENICHGINSDLSKLCEESTEKLNKELEEVLNSQPAAVFVSSIDSDYTPDKKLFEKKKNKITRLQYESLSAVVSKASGKTLSLATKQGTKATGLLLRSSEVSGSKIHSIVLSIGHKFGHKFKPWEAAGITKLIGNIAKFVGPALGVISVGLNIKEMVDASKKEKEIAKKQAEFALKFNELIEKIDEQYKHELQGAYAVYDETLVEVQESRKQVEFAIASNSSMIKEMSSIRENLIGLQKEIFI